MVCNFKAVWKTAMVRRPYPGFPPGTMCACACYNNLCTLACTCIHVTIAHYPDNSVVV